MLYHLERPVVYLRFPGSHLHWHLRYASLCGHSSSPLTLPSFLPSASALEIFIQSKRPDPNLALSSYESARTILTVLTNVLVTSMISFHLIYARRALSKVLPSRHLKLYTGVVAILVESALPLSVFGLTYAGIMIYTPKKTTRALEEYFALADIFAFLFYAFTVSSVQCFRH